MNTRVSRQCITLFVNHKSPCSLTELVVGVPFDGSNIADDCTVGGQPQPRHQRLTCDCGDERGKTFVLDSGRRSRLGIVEGGEGGGLAGGISAMPREEGGAPGHLDRVGSPSNYPTELRQRHKASDTGLE